MLDIHIVLQSKKTILMHTTCNFYHACTKVLYDGTNVGYRILQGVDPSYLTNDMLRAIYDNDDNTDTNGEIIKFNGWKGRHWFQERGGKLHSDQGSNCRSGSSHFMRTGAPAAR